MPNAPLSQLSNRRAKSFSNPKDTISMTNRIDEVALGEEFIRSNCYGLLLGSLWRTHRLCVDLKYCINRKTVAAPFEVAVAQSEDGQKV